jgi:hypothetical protein
MSGLKRSRLELNSLFTESSETRPARSIGGDLAAETLQVPDKSSTEKEATQIAVDDHAFLNHATTESGRDMVTFSAGPIRLRSARLATNSANIQHAPIAATL